MENGYNLCICKEDKSHIVIEENASSLPANVEIGSVLRKTEEGYILDKEATIEIAKQLRLRDIGGIIVIDYIDMQEEKNKQEVINQLTKNLKSDRTKSQILGFTKLNLLEMTRKNMCNNDWNNEGEE